MGLVTAEKRDMGNRRMDTRGVGTSQGRERGENNLFIGPSQSRPPGRHAAPTCPSGTDA